MQSFFLLTIQILLAVSLKSSTASYDKNDLMELKKLVFPYYPNCGVPISNNPKSTGHISSILNLDLNDMSWIVSIKTLNDDIHVCDGVLVTPNTVMTGAHCLKDNAIQKDNLIVLAGIPKFSKRSGIAASMPSSYIRSVSEIYIHPKYEACSQHNNHAILRLTSSFHLDKFVNVACLLNADTSLNTENCDLKLIKTTEAIKKKYDSEACGNRILDVTDTSKSLSTLSCEQGNNSTDFIRDTHGYLMSCKLSPESNQFYYAGVQTYVSLCGPNNSKYRFYDSTLYHLKWVHDTLKKINF